MTLRPSANDFLFAFHGWMIELHVETAATQGVSETALLVRSDQHKRDRFRLYCSKTRNTGLPLFQNFQQLRLELFAYLIHFIDQKHARLRAQESAQERARYEEVLAIEVR